jgi:hypothetical protein
MFPQIFRRPYLNGLLFLVFLACLTCWIETASTYSPLQTLPTLSVKDIKVQEGDKGATSAVFVVTLSAPSKVSVSVSYSFLDETAKLGSDYNATPGTLTFPPESVSQNIIVSIIGDTITESDETFSVNLGKADNATIADGQAKGIIVDDDPPSLSINDVRVTEGNAGGTKAVFTVTLSQSSPQTVTVNYASSAGTASPGTDYVEDKGTLTFASGDLTQSFAIAVNGDTTFEPDETFFVTLSAPLNAVISRGQGTGTIANDDAEPVPALSINDIKVQEGDSGAAKATFTVSLSFATKQTVTVDYKTGDGTATAGNRDYEADGATLTFAAGATTQTITVAVNGDTAVELDEDFFVRLSGPTNATIAKGQGTCTIVNDDADPVPALSINDIKVQEGDSGAAKATFTVSLSFATKQTVTVDFITADGTATVANRDYEAVKGTLTFSPGITTQSLTVAVDGDTAVEPDEEFFVRLSGPTNATITRGQGSCAIINDDENVQRPAISINDIKVTEGNAGGTKAVFNVSLSFAVKETVTVDFVTADGTATSANNDYVPGKDTVTFAAGVTTQNIAVEVTGDTAVEPDEEFFVRLVNPVNATIAKGQGSCSIVNDDADAQSRLSINDARVTEGNSGTTRAVFTVSLSAASRQTITVNYSTADGTAVAGTDYVADKGTLTFNPGITSQTVTIAVNGDTQSEPDESFFVNLSGAVGAAISDGQGTGTIVNDDVAAQPVIVQFSESGFKVSEDARVATVTITRTGGSAGRVTVNCATSNGTALAGSDYTANFGTIVFGDGDMSPKTFMVPILDDNSVEKDETINLVLSSPSGAALGNPSASVLVITDNDVSAAPILQTDRAVDFGAVDPGQTAKRSVSVRNGGGAQLTFSITLNDGAGSGFVIASQPAATTLGQGETATFDLAFKPVSGGLSTGLLMITSNGGNAQVKLFGTSDATPPEVSLLNPTGGETITSGMSTNIQFSGRDKEDALSGFTVAASTDGGASFSIEIARVGPDATSVPWNVPDGLVTTQAQVQVTARDRSGNTASAKSGLFTIRKPPQPGPAPEPMLNVVLLFDPPADDQVAPPQNLRVSASEAGADMAPTSGLSEIRAAAEGGVPTDLQGFNIYRVPARADGTLPGPDEVVRDENLIGSTSADATSFMDTVSTSKGNNFVYSATSFFGTGTSSQGSETAGTNLPVIKNVRFEKGTIFMDTSGSFISLTGAILIVDNKDEYPLKNDSTGVNFTVDKKTKGSGGLALKKLIKKNVPVRLLVRNPDGKLSVGVTLTRTN